MKKFVITAVALFTLIFVSCDKNADDPKEPTVELNNEINDFVWRGMNTHYYWQQDISNLADTKNDDTNEYNSYLNGYNDPEALFESLLFQKGTTDRFSWFIEDYRAQDASFRGVNDAFGFEFALARVSDTSNDVIGYITYVVPNTPASEAGLKRADVFNVFNDVELNLDNYSIVNKYYSDNTISMKFATIQNGSVVSNGKEANLTVRQVVENPVHYSSVLNIGGKKVGYLVYNSFKYTFHNELNEVFGTFKSEGIQELVLDLRYNGGGSVLTSAYLASMIHSGATTNEVFAKLIYNSKNSDENSAYPFFNKGRIYDIDGNAQQEITLNRLSTLSRIYVITSDDTASASEMVINGLSPYIQVIKVGTTTYGKNVGSFTVYDSPTFGSNNIDQSHTNAMQPITFKIFNKLDQSDYTLGFNPDIEQIEYVSAMKPFGDVNEPLLKRALDNISGAASKAQQLKDLELKTEQVFSSSDKRQFSKEMYIIPNEMNQ
ncbi:S41 family peptidase [Aureibaculum sp. 2210JD6-5]|uniref:S41 family peptidase n=1 Tax=Aureibaculum sp. 2210JD6-5 TaxID=3103957 RepID=UPI002AADB2CF|nr:S41 family peptidase [Aureibaculum sp. 2210JD6-5]MDY7394027.1 S41 family peptidase [Aureibaculum sp. 2210JD6-5]